MKNADSQQVKDTDIYRINNYKEFFLKLIRRGKT